MLGGAKAKVESQQITKGKKMKYKIKNCNTSACAKAMSRK